jgi:hypothetical protein
LGAKSLLRESDCGMAKGLLVSSLHEWKVIMVFIEGLA